MIAVLKMPWLPAASVAELVDNGMGDALHEALPRNPLPDADVQRTISADAGIDPQLVKVGPSAWTYRVHGRKKAPENRMTAVEDCAAGPPVSGSVAAKFKAVGVTVNDVMSVCPATPRQPATNISTTLHMAPPNRNPPYMSEMVNRTTAW